MKNIIKSWLPVLLWAAIIFLFSSNPDPYRYLPESWRNLVPIRQVSDSSLAEWIGQLMHFFEYAVLSFQVIRAVCQTKPNYPKTTLLVLILVMLFALSDEIHQIFVPGRTFQLLDLIIDFLGIIAGIFLFNKIIKKAIPLTP